MYKMSHKHVISSLSTDRTEDTILTMVGLNNCVNITLYTYLHVVYDLYSLVQVTFILSFTGTDVITYLHSLQWRHNGLDGVSNHQHHDCLVNRLFWRRSKKTSRLRVTGLCVGNSPVTGEFPAQMACNAENVSIWWRHHCYVTGAKSIIRLISCQRSNLEEYG